VSTSPTPARPPLYEQVAARVRELAEATGLGPGDRLPPERELAQHLGVSRSSVREALTLLRAAGLVHTRQGDGVYLQRPPEQIPAGLTAAFAGRPSMPRIMEVREALETHLARLAARRRSPQDVDRLSAAHEAMAAAIDRGDDPCDADARFHAAIAHAADNPMLEELMGQLATPIALTRRASLSRPGRPARSLEGHRRILEAIVARNEEGASAAMREHLMVVADVAHDAPPTLESADLVT
jgi:GntR family transcriptional repressor for pyruvate dehydrogenase complex